MANNVLKKGTNRSSFWGFLNEYLHVFSTLIPNSAVIFGSGFNNNGIKNIYDCCRNNHIHTFVLEDKNDENNTYGVRGVLKCPNDEPDEGKWRASLRKHISNKYHVLLNISDRWNDVVNRRGACDTSGNDMLLGRFDDNSILSLKLPCKMRYRPGKIDVSNNNRNIIFRVVESNNVNDIVNKLQGYLELFSANVKNPAVSFDIDGTLLTVKKGYNENNYARKQVCNLSIIRLYRICNKNGIKVVIITARPDIVINERKNISNRDLTISSLKECGITKYDELHLCPMSRWNNSGQWKTDTRANLAKKHNILLNIGDQWTDMSARRSSTRPDDRFVLGQFNDNSLLSIKLPSEFD